MAVTNMYLTQNDQPARTGAHAEAFSLFGRTRCNVETQEAVDPRRREAQGGTPEMPLVGRRRCAVRSGA